MRKGKKNRKISVIISILLLLTVIILVVTLSRKREEKVKKIAGSNSALMGLSMSSSLPQSGGVHESSIVSSSFTVKTDEGADSDLGQARTALYLAGINTSSVSDDQILKWWENSKKEGLDFVKYAKKQLGK